MKGKWCTASLIMNILKTVLPSIMFDLEKLSRTFLDNFHDFLSCAGPQGHATDSEEGKVEMGAVLKQIAGL